MRLVQEFEWKHAHPTAAYASREGWMYHALGVYEDLTGIEVNQRFLKGFFTDADVDGMVAWLNDHDKAD